VLRVKGYIDFCLLLFGRKGRARGGVGWLVLRRRDDRWQSGLASRRSRGSGSLVRDVGGQCETARTFGVPRITDISEAQNNSFRWAAEHKMQARRKNRHQVDYSGERSTPTSRARWSRLALFAPSPLAPGALVLSTLLVSGRTPCSTQQENAAESSKKVRRRSAIQTKRAGGVSIHRTPHVLVRMAAKPN